MRSPGTPLPWTRTGAMWIDARDPVTNDILYREGEYRHSIARFYGPEQAQNGDYVLHAAHAYPRLVEALASFLRAPSTGSSGPGSISIEVQSFNREAAMALLRELGEAP